MNHKNKKVKHQLCDLLLIYIKYNYITQLYNV